MTDRIDLAKMVVALEAESVQLRKEMEKANKHVDNFRKRAERSTAAFKKSFALLGAAIPIAALAGLTKHSIDFADAITDAAEKTNFGYRELQELRFAASQTGVSITELDGGLARFTKRLGLARMGTGAAADTYKKLGIDLSQTNHQVFRQVVETLGNMEKHTDRLALTTRLFGDDAQRLAQLFREGNVGLDGFAKKAHELGLVLSDDLINNASEANDQFAIMKQVVNAQTVQIFASLAPVITEVGQAFADAAPGIAAFFGSFGDIDNMTKSAAEQVAKRAQENYDVFEKQLKRRIDLDSGNVGFSPKTLLEQLLIPSEDELREDLAEQEKIFKEAIARIKSLGSATSSGDKPILPPVESLGLSGLFQGPSGSSKKNDPFKEMENDLKGLADTYKKNMEEISKITAGLDPSIPLLREIERLEELIFLYPKYEDVLTDAVFKKHEELDKINESLDDQVDEFKDLKLAVEGWGKSFADALADGSGNFSDFMSDISDQITRFALQRAVGDPLTKLLDGLFSDFDLSSLFGSGGSAASVSAATPTLDALNGLELNAKGNVYSSPGLSAYSGTVVNKPTIFPFARGAGLMGEAGYEGIFPLKRGRDGKLGVSAEGVGGTNVYINIQESSSRGGEVEERQTGDESFITVFVDRIKSGIASDIRNGRGAVTMSLENTYGLNRAAGGFS